ncbi:lipopolysaccharide biosynthesis protein [Halomonas sp. GXIMD04776]|uniref:lipopolysaccharide biosynthesis protein n=1 Tax=Halomonas sp. GXIMD04776 TaxID=3415605 RepID=UPI003CBC1740
MRNYVKPLFHSKFVRNVAVVASGTAGAQAITVAFSPIITRLYGPEAFGVLGTFTAMLAVVTPLAALSYPIAIVLPKQDGDAIGLVKLSLGIALVTSLLTTLMLLVFRDPIVSVFNLQDVGSFMLLLPLAMLSAACMAIASQWVIRKKLFKLKAKVSVLQALWINGAKAGIGLVTPVAAVLVILATLGSALHALMLYKGIRTKRADRFVDDQAVPLESPASYKALALRHRDFPYYRAPQVFLNAVSQSLPVLMLASFFGPAVAGFYSLGKMVLGVPSTLIGQSVASVFYPRINEAAHAGENTQRLILKATLALAAVGIVPYGVIVAFGPWLFSFVFGDEWKIAGVYAQWLALWSYFGFMNRPSVGAIPVLALQGFFLFYEIANVVLRALGLFLGFFIFESALMAIVMFSIVSVILNALLIFSTLIAAKKHDGSKEES